MRVAFIKDDNGELTLEDERIKTAINQIGAKMVVLDPIQAFIGHNGNMTNAVKCGKHCQNYPRLQKKQTVRLFWWDI